jgi:hypothetical protein
MTVDEETVKKSMAQKILDIDHRIMATVVIFIIVYTLMFPFKIPFPITQYGINYYNFVDNIEPGSKIGFMLSDTPSTRPSLQSSTVLTCMMLFEKDCKIIFWQDEATGPPIYEDYMVMTQAALGRQLEYGVDYVNLGYIAGAEAGTAAILADIRKTVGGVDAYGNSVDDQPVMEGINIGSDFDYGFANVACRCTEPLYVRQWEQPYGIRLATINCAMDLTAVQPYLATGQLKGTANGLLGSAEMEYLTGTLGMAFGQVLSVSMCGVYFILLIIVGNVLFFMTKSEKETA